MASAASTAMGSSALVLAFVCHLSCLLLLLLLHLPCTAHAQTTTDPTEAEALNTMFSRWDISAGSTWNISGDPCTGRAVDDTSFDDNKFNPFIKCDCSADNGTTCHITNLKVYALDVTGPIPEELQSLPQLSNLKLDQNYLTGSLPAFLGNFSNMQYMTFGINALSGPIPKELGNLTNLISLGLGSNNFNGSLPPEFGSLTNLEELYIDSSGLGGEIPSTFSKLQNLKKMWASGNNFTGVIPDFIGNLTSFTDLRLQGNSFQGPIPSSMAKLTKLQKLQIGDLTNGSFSLDFIQNMTSLSTLVLRNCKISNVIPSNFESYTSLQLLDLSFNNLTGQIPQSLFNLDSLNYLFLGNNSLSGSLPPSKASSILNIDLSYNNLSGTFPSWVSDKNINLNLVANNFSLDASNNSVLSARLDCLQKDIPCYRGSPTWSSFSVNCGSTQRIKSSDGTLYEVDDENANAASYYVSEDKRWAASNVGRFQDAPNETYVQSSSSQFTNTLDSELFQTARISPSSLRYYGIGLENGNYTIKLQFAETAFPDRQTWKSVGKRIFDIYIQEKLVAKDFDIRKEAGGTSFRAISRNYFANVTDNFLQIHFFWAGKGTCCIPKQGTYGPSISAISVTPNFTPTVSNQLPSSNKSKALVIGLVIGITTVCVLLLLVVLIWRKKRTNTNMNGDEELLRLSIKSELFSFEELRTSTGNFSQDHKLGEGGFGAVFKGNLLNGRLVAIKQLSLASHQGKQQFIAEIETLSTVRHRNLVELYGCCYERDKHLLVYEYLENKSLDQALFDKTNLKLEWSSRFMICLGTARALAYLHEESSVRIVHRDVKASNILLDGNLNPKISDFGLAKLFDDKKTHISTRIAGTTGYLAPEYALRGHLTEKADVFGFGVVALEVVTGRPNTDTTSLDPEKVYLLEWAWHLYENNNELEMMDPTLSKYNKEEALRVIGVALLCTQTSPFLRPSMSRVVSMLTGAIEVTKATSRPSYLIDWRDGESTSTFTTNASDVSAGGTAGISQTSPSL